MSFLTVAWSMCAAASAMMALLQLLLWLMLRPTVSILWAVAMAVSAAAVAMIELGQIFAPTVEAYGKLLVWQNAGVYVLLMSLIWFVRTHYRSGRLWLAVLITAIWSLAIVINFISPYSLVFDPLVELKRGTMFWGESFAIPVGSTNPWKILADLASILIAAYILDAAVQLWRRGQRRRAWVAGIGMLAFIAFAGVHAVLVDAGLLSSPYMISFAFLAIVVGFAYELVSEAVKVRGLTRELLAKEQRWRALLENVRLAVVGSDREGRINYANPFLLDLLGRPGPEVLGQPLTFLVPASAADELKHRFAVAARSAPRPRSRWELLTASGEVRDVEWSNVRLNDAEGRFAGLLSIGVDVTQQFRAERELQDTRLQMERLARANLLGELASALAHELNQPLAAILANAQAGCRLLSRDPAELAEVAEILDDIVRDDKRAGEVIRRLRELLRTGEVQRERLSLNAAVAEVLQLVKGELQAQHVAIERELAEGLPDVEAGKVEIQQVVMNFILNAVQALRESAPSAPRIRIRTRLTAEVVSLDVEDNGPGVPVDDLPQVFEPLFSTKRTGLGVGLAICRRIIDACGGQIEARNLPGGGACFSFSLPALPTTERLSA